MPSTRPEHVDRRVVLSGTLSVADVLHAQRLATSRLRWPVILGIFIIIAVYFRLIDRPISDGSIQWMHSMLFLICIATPLAFAIIWASRLWSFLRQSRQHVGIFAPSESVITPEGLSTVTEHSEWRIKWTLFRGFRASDRVVVLYLQFPTQYFLISRAKLEDSSQWPLVLELASDALPRV
jgi:hypothetical protein